MTASIVPSTVIDLLSSAEATGELAGVESRPGKGHVRLHFRNGWIVSVGYGPTYAADNHGKLLSVQEEILRCFGPPDDDPGWMSSATAEVMVIKPDGNRMIWPDNDDGILGFHPVESVAALIRMVANEGQG